MKDSGIQKHTILLFQNSAMSIIGRNNFYSLHKWLFLTKFIKELKVSCRGPAPAGSRGTLRMNGVDERETRRTGLNRAKSARERERKKERD